MDFYTTSLLDSDESDELHVCPLCQKFYQSEKELYLHIMRAHQDSERLANELRADLYTRWRDRISRHHAQ